MQETNFYKLRKPDEADFINVEDLNFNADVVDRELNDLKNNSVIRVSTTDEAFINMLTGNTGKVGQDYLFGSKGDKNGENLYSALQNCVSNGYTINIVNLSGENEGLLDNHFKEPAYYLATFLEAKKVAIRILTTPVEVIDNLTDGSTDKPISVAQGKWLNENKLTNKKKTLSIADLNNPNYPEPYVCSTDKGKEIGLPTSQAYIQYFRNENDDGFGTQIAYKLDRANQEGDNSKLWTMKIRVASAMTWGAWENVATSVPKGHYAVTNLNTCQEDGNHYYFINTTANKPPLHSDGIVSVYAYNAGNNEQQSFAPYIVQVAHSWWQESIFMRSGKNGAFSNWKEVLTSNNAAFSVDDAGLHMKKPLFFTATDGSSHTLQEVFQSASNGKVIIANAITGKGVPTSTTGSWLEMARNIGKITGVKTGSIMANADDNSDTGTIVTLPANMTFAFFYSPNGNRITSVRKINQLYQIASITMGDVIRHRIDSSDCIDVTHYSGTSFKLRPYYYNNGISVTSRIVNWIAIE